MGERPAVISLRYRLVLSENVSFANTAAPVEDVTDAFSMRLEDGVVTFEMRENHATEESARRSVERYLRSSEIDRALSAGRREIRFEFEGAEVIDRDPPKPGEPGAPQVVEVEGIASAGAFATAAVVVTRGSYPTPPTDLILDADVETSGIAGRVTSTARSRSPRWRTSARRPWTVWRPELARHLAQRRRHFGAALERGGKADATRPLWGEERAWLEATVKEIIRRLSQVAAGIPPSPLTIAGLPDL